MHVTAKLSTNIVGTQNIQLQMCRITRIGKFISIILYYGN